MGWVAYRVLLLAIHQRHAFRANPNVIPFNSWHCQSCILRRGQLKLLGEHDPECYVVPPEFVDGSSCTLSGELESPRTSASSRKSEFALQDAQILSGKTDLSGKAARLTIHMNITTPDGPDTCFVSLSRAGMEGLWKFIFGDAEHPSAAARMALTPNATDFRAVLIGFFFRLLRFFSVYYGFSPFSRFSGKRSGR